MYAMYNHPTKEHSATARVMHAIMDPSKVAREAKSDAPPGQWAVAYITSGRFGGD